MPNKQKTEYNHRKEQYFIFFSFLTLYTKTIIQNTFISISELHLHPFKCRLHVLDVFITVNKMSVLIFSVLFYEIFSQYISSKSLTTINFCSIKLQKEHKSLRNDILHHKNKKKIRRKKIYTQHI